MSDWLSGPPQVPMPPPNPNNAAKKTPDKTNADLGVKLAKRKSQDFASKIQGWNDHGAGVVQQQDEVVVIVGEDEGGKKTKTKKKADETVEVTVEVPTSDEAGDGAYEEGTVELSPGTQVTLNGPMATSARTAREVDLGRKAWVRRKSKPQIEISAEVKEATTPKKRVISDGHWRKDRTARPENVTSEKDSPPKPVVTVRRSVASVGLKVPPSVQDFIEEQNPGAARVRPIRRSRSGSRSRSREREATAPDYEDRGVKIYVKRRVRARTDARTSEISLTAGSSISKPSSSTDVTTPSQSPTKTTPPRPSTAPREKTSRRSLDDEVTPKGANKWKSRTPEPRSEKVKAAAEPVLKPSSKPAAPFTPQVYGNRIEGWLAGMSEDPFTGSKDASVVPEPLDISKRSSKPRVDHDASDARDESGNGRRSSGRRRRSRPSLETIDTKHEGGNTELSPPTTPVMRRRPATRKATHSPIKDRVEHETASTVDSFEGARSTSTAGLERHAQGKAMGARPFPSTGRGLSTVGSTEPSSTRSRRVPSDASDQPTIIPDGSVLSRASDSDVPRRQGTTLKRRMTKHSDLISVLSLPREEKAGIVSARSVRTRRHDPESATIGDLMNEVTTDELKYQRELRTLVGGVIPVLLTYVLQKTDASGSKRLFSGTSPDGQAVTKPIVEMGVALERLKSLHKRIPLHDSDDLLRWASIAAKAYSQYLKAWRLGFEDVVVNLAPAEENEGLPRDGTGDLVGGDGERVDVAFLLKRPLVRLKYLAKTFKSIDQVKPSTAAEDMTNTYQSLVQDARQRVNEERARLEDEVASSIDPTRARDPRSLAPLMGVSIDPTRSVRARDYFDMDLVHSSGQQLVCKIEIILRDDAPGRGDSGDVLFCEVSTAGRWLLFPPIPYSYVSARPGDKDGEIVAMVRGMLGEGSEWRELMSLTSDGDGTIAEWLDMLSSSPAPPRLMRTSSFNTLRSQYMMTGGKPDAGASIRPPSPSEVDVPIGERATSAAQRWTGSDVNSGTNVVPSPRLRRAKAKRYRSTPSSPATEDSYEQVHARANRIAKHYDDQSAYDDGRSRYHERPKSSYIPSTTSNWTASSTVSTPRKEYSVWLPTTDRGSDDSSGSENEQDALHKRPSMHRRTSSVPSMEMPTLPKLRKSSHPSTPRQLSDHHRTEFTPARTDPDPASAPAKLEKRRKVSPQESLKKREQPPSTPTQARPTSLGLRSGLLPSFTPAFLKRHRRSSSPLKHEYEPSTASESLSESDVSNGDEVESVTSESTVEDEAVSTIGELKNFRNLGSVRPLQRPPPPPKSSSSSGGGDTVGPSESASQAPYRTVPATAAQSAKTVACIFSWADRGSWDSLHPEECSIFVTPGLIEAFDLSQAHAVSPTTSDGLLISPSQRGVKPLVALELTPLVPLRRGTAVDISIRSPPTPNSLIRTGNNLMFRSRSPEECEKLYSLINRARIDNPTYIALQNARGPAPTSNWAEVMDRRNAARTSGSGPSWFRGSRKSSTYRSNGSRPVSIAATESSVNTMNTAFSALRRFSGGSRSIFNIAKSTLTSREGGGGTRSSYSDSLSSGAATPMAMPIDPSLGTPLGITNAKIRLYIRETASKWRDMGSARLTVMLPPPPPRPDANPRTTGLEKRVLVCGKSHGETLLDVTLGESCFERVARTGIAISVWEETLGANGQVGIGAVGGVVGTRSKVYMVQMKSERDAAYTFGLVGKLRY